MNLLIVEDDLDYREEWRESFIRHGLEVFCESKAERVVINLDKGDKYDVIILDLNLKGSMSGIDLIRVIRVEKNDQTPVIVLTSSTILKDQLDILDLDPFIELFDKRRHSPSNPEVILKKVDVLTKKSSKTYRIGVVDFKISSNSSHIFINNKNAHLTVTEFQILKTLLENYKTHSGERPTLRSEILKNLGHNADAKSDAIQVHITNLRKKLNGLLIIEFSVGGYFIHEV